MPWDPDDVVILRGSVVSQAIAGKWVLSRRLNRVGVVTVAPDLSLTRERTTIWLAPMDGEGLPVLKDWQRWPLEEP
jgi:hypothetical protein